MSLIKIKPLTITVEFNINCKCGKNFESIAYKKSKVPKKHTAKCPNCNTKHYWNAN